MDSATCLALAARRGTVHALSVHYGQRHPRELRSARALARHFGAASHSVVRLPIGPLLDSALTQHRRTLTRRPGRSIPPTYVPARNTLFLALALGLAESRKARAIYFGANAVDYSGYPDCRPEFVRAFRRLARLATKTGVEGRPIAIRAPLLHRSKPDIVRLGERLRVPWALTWSCYEGGRRPCSTCDACRLRRRGFKGAHVRDPLDIAGTTP
ncbi:MAG: 7-cyano-7-deazaguanine synthase QueC [Thermoplasmata archaeon]|nr:7-cyano-7-deazaguanine synthase QueC [Thermoplasmata archaeon]